jgi:hypothetical protein
MGRKVRIRYDHISPPLVIQSCVLFARTTVKEEEDLEEKSRRDKDSKEDKGACILASGS